MAQFARVISLQKLEDPPFVGLSYGKHGEFPHIAMENALFVHDSRRSAHVRWIFAPNAEHVGDYADFHEL